MLIYLVALAGQAAIPGASGAPNRAVLFPAANELFDRDPVVRDWALRQFDLNGDGWLTLYEAQPALAAFKEIADSDRDGRITTAEYRRAREFVVAR
jgi:hypothetical protein